MSKAENKPRPRRTATKPTPVKAQPRKDETPESLMSRSQNEPEPVRDENEQRQTPDFAELERIEEKMRLSDNDGKFAAPTQQDGDSIVRMINTRGDCIAVSARFVPLRLMDGYRFIHSEPSIPLISVPKNHHHNRPADSYTDPNYRLQGRPTDNPKNEDQAFRVWYKEMQQDSVKMRDRTDLDWNYMREVGRFIVAKIPGTTATA